ncbi:ATP-dependent helicase [Mesorhizobium sp. M0678]|uniref:ATP-dependent helicase n=1 Tax=Mesorhizobium sp. M0678 TaxID=2956985 RepID=UPI00333A3A1D
MTDTRLLEEAIAALGDNQEQLGAVNAKGHCVVLAGPGSGKTKTLTTAMVRTLIEDVLEPRGIACITYNNECVLELQERLAKLGIEENRYVFIGTVHSFAFTQILLPYARCAMPELTDARPATDAERRGAVERAFAKTIGGPGNPHERWKFAAEKRRDQVDRDAPEWANNPELVAFVEAYEADLHGQGLVDFDDMPLLAYRLVKQHQWIRNAVRAKYPVLFVDEYQDLGHALHELVLLLCFGAGIRLFAVGDADQSMYGFQGAAPELLKSLSERDDVIPIRLRFNYRSGTRIIAASLAALGEARDYQGRPNAGIGTVDFHGVAGDLDTQADYVFKKLLPPIMAAGTPLSEIAILYRTVKQSNSLALAAAVGGVPIVRADNNALVKRSLRLSRFLERAAAWQSGGWKSADPPFLDLAREASSLVYGSDASNLERADIRDELMRFLHKGIGTDPDAHKWLQNFEDEVGTSWRARARNPMGDWSGLDRMRERTDPETGDIHIPLSTFAGWVEGEGRLTLSTLHSAKGREWDVVILFAMNADVIPHYYDKTVGQKLEARRQFYVGVTRPRKALHIVYQEGNHSPFVAEVYQRLQASG